MALCSVTAEGCGPLPLVGNLSGCGSMRYAMCQQAATVQTLTCGSTTSPPYQIPKCVLVHYAVGSPGFPGLLLVGLLPVAFQSNTPQANLLVRRSNTFTILLPYYYWSINPIWIWLAPVH